MSSVIGVELAAVIVGRLWKMRELSHLQFCVVAKSNGMMDSRHYNVNNDKMGRVSYCSGY